MSQCIYCFQDSVSAFPAEHVLPLMFGHFHDNLTLSCVCGACNNYFSRLELSFGRDTAEAIERLRHGLKPLSDVDEIGKRRLRDMFVDQHGVHDGARVRISATDGRMSIKPEPQVGFRRGEERPIWLDEHDLTAESLEPYRHDYAWIIRGATDDDVKRLTEKITALGFRIRDPLPLEPPGADGDVIDTLVSYTFDESMQRVVAKIAFNYTAYVVGAAFMMQSDFDSIRNFIRYGTPTTLQQVFAVSQQVLSDETPELRREGLHLLTVRWIPTTASLLGQVALFNRFNYWVGLAVSFAGVWQPIQSGHCFDIATCEISELASSVFPAYRLGASGEKPTPN